MIQNKDKDGGIWWQVEHICKSASEIDMIADWCSVNIGLRYANWRSPAISYFWFKDREDAIAFELAWGYDDNN